MHLLITRFSDTSAAWNSKDIAERLGIPIRLVNRILYDLVSSGIVSEVKMEDGREVTFQPARDTDMMTVKYVLDALDNRGCDSIPIARSEELTQLSHILSDFDDQMERSPANKRLKDI